MLLLSVTLLLLILMHFAPNLTAAIQEFPFAQNEVGGKKIGGAEDLGESAYFQNQKQHSFKIFL